MARIAERLRISEGLEVKADGPPSHHDHIPNRSYRQEMIRLLAFP